MIGVDVVPVRDQEEALTLMLHHLQLAAMYFEATPKDIPRERYGWTFSAPAIDAWIAVEESLYPED